MKKYTYAIIAFEDMAYIDSYKGYKNEETAITKCNELNRYADDLLHWKAAFVKYKDTNEELASLYEEQDVVWKEFDKFK